MHRELGGDQDGQRDQKTNVRLDVINKWNRNLVAQRVTGQGRQQQQRHPCDAGDDHDPATHQLERVSGHMHPPEQLKQRPPEHQGEVGLLFQNGGFGHWGSVFSRSGGRLRANRRRDQ